MTAATTPNESMSMMLGEVRGQLREVVHSLSNLSMKVDGIAEKQARAGDTQSELAALKLRVVALETERNRRDGATGIVGALLKSPAIGWLVGAAAAVWAYLSEGGHL